jgi:hypothetical protein
VTFLSGLNAIDWASLNQAYGSATNVPELLRALWPWKTKPSRASPLRAASLGARYRSDAVHLLIGVVPTTAGGTTVSRCAGSGASTTASAATFLSSRPADSAGAEDRDDVVFPCQQPHQRYPQGTGS